MRTVLLLLVLAAACVCRAAPDTSADELLKRAVSLSSSGRLDDAERVLLAGKSAFAQDARFPVELAGVSWRRKQFAQTKTYLRQGLRLDPSSAYANEFLGTLYLLDGNLYAALKYWNRVHRPVLSSVSFAPEPPLSPALYQRLSAVSAGQLLTESRLSRTERNLDRLRIFADPRFELTPARDNEYDLTVRSPVVSQPVSGIAGRVLPLLRGLPYQQVNLDWINIQERGILLTSIWRWDPDKRRIAAKLRAPAPRGTFALWVDFRDEDWDLMSQRRAPFGAIDVNSAALGGEVEFDLGQGSLWTPGVLLSRHTFRNAGLEPLLANSTLWEIRNRFDLPRWRDPERRIQLDSSATLRTGRIFSTTSSRLFGAEFEAAARWLPQARDDLYALRGRLRGGAVSGRIPLDELYMTAMERDNDLWLRGHAGTRHGKKGAAPMGTRFVVAQTEAVRRVFQIPFLRIDAGPFLDIGNVGGVSGLGSRGWLFDAGAQAVVTTVGGFQFSVIYGRDLRGSKDVLYTAISR